MCKNKIELAETKKKNRKNENKATPRGTNGPP